jgi:hypothetical protein
MVNVGIFYDYLEYFIGIIYGRLVLFMAVWYIFPNLVRLDQEKFWQLCLCS